MSDLLTGKTALITGAAHGFGAACAKLFHENGANVVIADIDLDSCQTLSDKLGRRALGYKLDVTNSLNFKECISETVSSFEKLDILVNNAAKILPGLTVDETNDEDFDSFIAVNLKGPFHGLKYCYPHLRKTRGCVLNVSSMAGVTGQAKHAVYAATKGGLNALTKATAVDWGNDGIRVNALCPLAMWTDALRDWLKEQGDPKTMETWLNNLSSLGYTPEAEEVAASALYLCSDLAKFVTGVILPVSGGGEVGYKVAG